jgi:sugar lactone lactonase YvrE
MDIRRVGDFRLGWGESLVWDDLRRRLYFVDCAAQTLHWLDDVDDAAELHTVQLPSMAAGIVPTDDPGGRLVGALHDGLHLIDPDAGTTTLLAEYPAELDGRCNDACADLSGNLITGKLNVVPAAGSTWWYSAAEGWRLLDPDIGNTNGPTVAVLDGTMTLIVGDTSANYYRYDYSPAEGSVGERSVFGDVAELAGLPDGATLDTDGGLWCAMYSGAQLVRFTTSGFDRSLQVPAVNPTDLTFAGPDLDRLYIVSVEDPNGGPDSLEGALLVVDGLGFQGRLEPRFSLGA